jgi:protection-of-telomeres protein 1
MTLANTSSRWTRQSECLFISAKHLLTSPSLNKDPQGTAVRQLEEKLFILWGNLQELKQQLMPQGIKFPLPHGDERLQNKPFECCIGEYGAKVEPSLRWPHGWQRMYRLMATTIMS